MLVPQNVCMKNVWKLKTLNFISASWISLKSIRKNTTKICSNWNYLICNLQERFIFRWQTFVSVGLLPNRHNNTSFTPSLFVVACFAKPSLNSGHCWSLNQSYPLYFIKNHQLVCLSFYNILFASPFVFFFLYTNATRQRVISTNVCLSLKRMEVEHIIISIWRLNRRLPQI